MSTTTTITSDTQAPSTVGQAYTVNFTVTSTGGTPTGNVTVSDGTHNCVGTVAVGSCALTTTTGGIVQVTTLDLGHRGGGEHADGDLDRSHRQSGHLHCYGHVTITLQAKDAAVTMALPTIRVQ